MVHTIQTEVEPTIDDDSNSGDDESTVPAAGWGFYEQSANTTRHFSRPQAQLSRSTFALYYVWFLGCPRFGAFSTDFSKFQSDEKLWKPPPQTSGMVPWHRPNTHMDKSESIGCGP